MSLPPDLPHRSSLMTMRQVASYLVVTERTVRRFIRAGRLRAYRVGRQLRFRPSDVDAMLSPATAGEAADRTISDFIRQGIA